MNKKYYLDLRNKYLPKNIKIVFILESPPVSGKYFYNEEGSVKEPLFSAMMKLIGLPPGNKQEGLTYFANKGYFIVDATYEPVNKLKNKERNDKILENFEYLVKVLIKLGDPKKINTILIKSNICRLLENKLLHLGYKVLNNGIIIPFPSTGQQKKFMTEALKVLGKKTTKKIINTIICKK